MLRNTAKLLWSSIQQQQRGFQQRRFAPRHHQEQQQHYNNNNNRDRSEIWQPFRQRQRHRSVQEHLSAAHLPVISAKFSSILPDAVDSGAEAFVLQHYRRNKDPVPAPEVSRVGTDRYATMNITLPNGQVGLACGRAARSSSARFLCFMHAKNLLLHAQQQQQQQQQAGLMPGKKSEHPQQQQQQQNVESAPLPPPLSLRTFDDMQGMDTPPQPSHFVTWQEYVTQSATYIAKCNEARRAQAIALGRIPESGNPIADSAGRTVDPKQTSNQALGALHNYYVKHEAPIPVLTCSNAMHGMNMATLIIDGDAKLIAVGVAKGNKEARHRCAMHALAIFQLMQGDALMGAAMQSKSGERSLRITGLPEAYTRILDYYSFFTGYRGRSVIDHDASRGLYVCRYTLGEITCEGTGINRAEAERTAVEQAVSDLRLCDAAFVEVCQFVEMNPHMDVYQIQKAALGNELKSRIQNLLQRHRSRLLSNADGLGSTHPTAERYDPDNFTRCLMSATSPRERNLERARELQDQLHGCRTSREYHANFHARRSTLAMATIQKQIVDTVRASPVTIICGTTGCGKTTQVPQYLFDDAIREGKGDQCSIIVTQPRRISAMSIADRIAAERLQTVGHDVGYTIRLDSKPGMHINLCTTGVLLQVLLVNPDLIGISHIILDEIHERDVNCDVALALVKEALSRNFSLRVVCMSATMQSTAFSKYFENAPILQVEGAVFPVEEVYLDEIAASARRDGITSPMLDELTRQNSNPGYYTRLRSAGYAPLAPKTDYYLLSYIVRKSIAAFGNLSNKSVLVFLPGWKELLAAKQAMEQDRDARGRYHFILLHSTVESAEQNKCFAPAPNGMTKVVLATNIAESGITIDDVAIVIDTGLIKQTTLQVRGAGQFYSAEQTASATDGSAESSNRGENSGSSSGVTAPQLSAATQLMTMLASKANCIQRKGRAGRTQGGVCYRLFSRATWESLSSHPIAEIHRTSLDSIVLRLLAMGYDDPRVILQKFIEPPPRAAVELSMRTLLALGAIDRESKLSKLGKHLARLPCEPRIGKMIIMGAVLQCLDSVLTIAACSEVEPFISRRDIAGEVRKRRFAFSMRSQSDHIANVNAYNSIVACGSQYAVDNYINVRNVVTISKYKEQYFTILCSIGMLQGNSFLRLRRQRTRHDADLFVDGSPLSYDARNVGLVKACICAGLYPNVAMLCKQGRVREAPKALTVRIKESAKLLCPGRESSCRRIAPHPISNILQRDHNSSRGAGDGEESESNREQQATAPSLLYVFRELFGIREARHEFLTTVSAVSVWALLLVGVSSSCIDYNANLQLCIIDGWIMIRCTEEVMNSVLDLKALLDSCILKKFANPMDVENNDVLLNVLDVCKELLSAPLEPLANSNQADGSNDRGAASNSNDAVSAQGVEQGRIMSACGRDGYYELKQETRRIAAENDHGDYDGAASNLPSKPTHNSEYGSGTRNNSVFDDSSAATFSEDENLVMM